jgi:hypothetical protein
MKNLVLIIILSLLLPKVNAQISEKYFLVDFAIKEGSILTNESNKDIRDLYFNKLSSIFNKLNHVIIDNQSNYQIVSDFHIKSNKTSKAGFMTIGVYNIELTIHLINKLDNKTYKTFVQSKEYTSNTEAECVRNFINDIDIDKNTLDDFIIVGRNKMLEFYSKNCNEILNSVKKYQTVGELEKALAICATIPSDVSCFERVDTIANSLYTALSYKMDNAIFLTAQNLINNSDYETAINKLKEISIYSKFYSQAQNTSSQITSFLLLQRELDKKKELKAKETELKKAEVELQQKKNELQVGINTTNKEIANIKADAEKIIRTQEIAAEKEIKSQEIDAQIRRDELNKARQEEENNSQLRREELAIQRKEMEIDASQQRQRNNLIGDYFLKSLAQPSSSFTIIR